MPATPFHNMLVKPILPLYITCHLPILLCLAPPGQPLAPHSPSASVEAILALSLPFSSQWQAVSPSEKTPDLKRALRTLLSKMKVKVKHTHACCTMHPRRELLKYPLPSYARFEAHGLNSPLMILVKRRASNTNIKLPSACFAPAGQPLLFIQKMRVLVVGRES